MAGPRAVETAVPRKRKKPGHGGALIETALLLAAVLPVLLGVAGVGMRLGRSLEGMQVTRDVAHMYALGTDFSLPGTQAIAQALSRTFTLTSTGNSVLILSRIVKVYQADCDGAGLGVCPNLGQTVLAQRLSLGNTGLRASSFGTPPGGYLDSQGNIRPADYCTQSSLMAAGFDAVLALLQGQSAYLVEGYFSMPELDLLHPGQGGGYYVRLML